jgi:DNA-binding PadR family transcriptional regulator
VGVAGKDTKVNRDIGLIELRRGVLVLAVLSQLRQRQYGYSLRQELVEGGMPVEEGTLYPLLRRLESQGLLDSEWDTEAAPPRRYYRLNSMGKQVLTELAAAWRAQVDVVDGFLGGA